ncbi:unnamed protein product, partial [Protopolystoma xenopodis]
ALSTHRTRHSIATYYPDPTCSNVRSLASANTTVQPTLSPTSVVNQKTLVCQKKDVPESPASYNEQSLSISSLSKNHSQRLSNNLSSKPTLVRQHVVSGRLSNAVSHPEVTLKTTGPTTRQQARAAAAALQQPLRQRRYTTQATLGTSEEVVDRGNQLTLLNSKALLEASLHLASTPVEPQSSLSNISKQLDSSGQESASRRRPRKTARRRTIIGVEKVFPSLSVIL